MMKKLVYISIPASMIAAGIFSVDFGIFQLSLFRLLIMAAFLWMAVRILLNNEPVNIPRGRYNNFSVKVMGIWFLYAIFTAAFVKDDTGWYRAVYFLMLGFLCVLIFSKYLTDTHSILTAFRLMAAMAVVHNMIGWSEILTGHYLFLDEKVDVYAMYEYPVSMFDNTNNMALFMLLSIFAAYVCSANTRRRTMKLLYYLLMLSSAYLMYKTNSRANLLGLAAGCALFILMKLRSRRVRRLVLLACVAAAVYVILKPDVILHLYTRVMDKLSLGFSGETDSNLIRLNLIRNGALFLVRSFGFGVGAGNIEYWMSHFRVFDTGIITNMHNWWMEILTGYGVVIFILYILFYVRLFKTMYNTYRKSTERIHSSLSLGIMCFMAGFVLGSISASSNITTEWLWVYWGIVIAYQGTLEPKGRSVRSEEALLPVSPESGQPRGREADPSPCR